MTDRRIASLDAIRGFAAVYVAAGHLVHSHFPDAAHGVRLAFAFGQEAVMLFFLLSGYFVPVRLFPRWLSTVADALPFRPMLGLPVEELIGLQSRASALRGMAVEWAWVVACWAGALILFNRGARRYSAYGA